MNLVSQIATDKDSSPEELQSGLLEALRYATWNIGLATQYLKPESEFNKELKDINERIFEAIVEIAHRPKTSAQ